jgi:uncharacterized membrane protein YphA (DoxX/SURF4 family)
VSILRKAGKVLGHPSLVMLFRLVPAVVFIVASIPKIQDPVGFGLAAHRYGMLPTGSLQAWFALILPVLELWVGLGLLVGFWTRANALLCGGMLVMFIIALTSAVERGLNIDCGCFDPDGASPVGYRRIIEDVILLLLCIPPLIRGSGWLGVDALFRRRSPSPSGRGSG